MPNIAETDWVLLVYRIPSQPTRLRLQIWRKLHRMGALYLQDAVCLLPDQPEHRENMQYVAMSIEELGGTCYLCTAATLPPARQEDVIAGFRSLADGRLQEIADRLDALQRTLDDAALPALEQAEDALKRERVAYLRARKLAYFGCNKEADIDSRLESLKRRLDELYRSNK